MKKQLIIATLALSLAGCAFFQAQKANWEACKSDPACVEQAKGWQSKGEMTGKIIATGAATIVPGVAVAIDPVGKAVGYLGFALAMLLGGHVILKKKVIQPA